MSLAQHQNIIGSTHRDQQDHRSLRLFYTWIAVVQHQTNIRSMYCLQTMFFFGIGLPPATLSQQLKHHSML